MCTLSGCAADHQHGDTSCAVDVAIPVLVPGDREPVVILSAVRDGNRSWIVIDADGPARVDLGDLVDAVAAAAAALLPAATV